MKVSVVLPVHNGGRFLRETLESVFRQTCRPFDVVAVDDGSTDDSLAVLRAFPGAVRVIAQENAGVSAARNRAVQEAGGELIALIDQDDVWYPHKLERQLEVYRTSGGRPFVYSDLDLIDSQGRVTGERVLSRLHAKWMCPFIGGHLHPYPSTVLMSRALYLEEGGFDPQMRGNGHEDVDFWIRLYPRTPFVLIPEALIRYRYDRRERKRKGRNLEMEAANAFHLHRKHEQRFCGDPATREALDRLLSVAHGDFGKARLLAGDLQAARKHFKEAYRVFPRQKKNLWRYWRTFLPAGTHRHFFSR